MSTQDVATDPAGQEFARALGARLRAVRIERQLSLHGVERKSAGRWKAVVIGSYERGDRSVSARRLAELADFYGVPVSELLPDSAPPGADGARIALDIARVQGLSGPIFEPLVRFVTTIVRRRGDATARAVVIRHEDLETMAVIYDATVEELLDMFAGWGVLVDGSLPDAATLAATASARQQASPEPPAAPDEDPDRAEGAGSDRMGPDSMGPDSMG